MGDQSPWASMSYMYVLDGVQVRIKDPKAVFLLSALAADRARSEGRPDWCVECGNDDGTKYLEVLADLVAYAAMYVPHDADQEVFDRIGDLYACDAPEVHTHDDDLLGGPYRSCGAVSKAAVAEEQRRRLAANALWRRRVSGCYRMPGFMVHDRATCSC